MARPIWKGHVSFGLVTIPVSLASLESPEGELSFAMLDKKDQSRIKFRRVSEKTGREVPWSEIVKGYELDDGSFVIVTPEDLKKAAPRTTRSIDITDFVDRGAVAPEYYERPYVLEPIEGGEKGYSLLRQAMEETKRIGIAKITLHTRQHLAALIPVEKALILNTMRFQTELRPLKEFELSGVSGTGTKVIKREVEMARMLVDGMASEWDPGKYHDEYRDQLRTWIARTARSGKTVAVEEEGEETPGPYNIMELLKKSVEGQTRGHGATGHRKTRAATARRKAG